MVREDFRNDECLVQVFGLKLSLLIQEKGVLQDSYVQNEPRRLTKSKQFTSLAIGNEHSLALTSSGQIFGFGKGYCGEMHSKEPVLLPLSADVDPSTKFVKIASGAHHCAAIDSKGLVYTWGDGTGGGLFSLGGLLSAGGGQLGQGKDKTIISPK
jgi:alpha-tubulin suppressor-like RCC1 family protein